MKRVVIVNAGGRMSSSAEKSDYQPMVDYLVRHISGLTSPSCAGEKAATVQVVTSVAEARELIYRADVMFFMTLGLVQDARRMKAANPNVKVIVLTGLLPEKEVVLVDKGWLCPEVVENLVTD